MKKTLIYALALALALSLAACGQPTDPAPGTSTPEPIAAPEPTKDTTPKTTEGAQPPEDGQALEELNHDELIAVFGPVYEASKEVNNSDSEETIQNELLMIEMTTASMSKSLPSDYETQYREWRPSVISQAPEVTLTFTDCNETVWATGTVNLRSGPSTEDDKVGSLNKNQSVTRIGIGTGDYANWSKVKLSDGSEVYVASKYLTTTKPASQPSSKTSGGGTSSTAGSQQTQGGATIIDDTEGLNIVSGSDFNKTIITDQNELDTGLDDPYASYGKVTIGYGGSGG